MLKKIIFFLIIVLVAYFLVGSSSKGTKSLLTIEVLKGKSGNEYLIIYKNAAKIDFEIARPDKKDTNIYLCISGAFTTLDNYAIDGLYICSGKTENKNKINHSLGGAVKIINGECSIFPTNKGKFLTDSLISTIEKKGGSLFQQIQMIVNGEAATFKDTKLFQRRGVVIFKNGKTAIAESKNAITLKVFADDLTELGVKDLLYTDMGSWDEGWYKDKSGKLIILGMNRSETSKQSNWVVFRK